MAFPSSDVCKRSLKWSLANSLMIKRLSRSVVAAICSAAKEAAMAGAKTGLRQTLKTTAFRFTDFVADMGKGAYQFANQSTDALSAAGKVTQKANQAKNLLLNNLKMMSLTKIQNTCYGMMKVQCLLRRRLVSLQEARAQIALMIYGS